MTVIARFPIFLVALRLAPLVMAVLLVACGSGPPPPVPVRPAIVARPAPSVGTATTFFSGDVRARHESQLGFRVGGKISRRLVDAGARVAAGDVLAVIDPDDLRLDLAATEAAVASAGADLALARAEYDRYTTLLERRLVSESQFEAQRTALAAAQARLEQAQTQQAVAGNQVGYAQLRADVAGTVTSISAEAGQVVAPGQVVAVLAQDGDREIEIALPEAEFAHYPVGTKAEVSVWSTPDRRISGEVREVAPSADPASRTYRARVRLLAQDDAAQLGMTARVYFAATGTEGALTLPLTALHAVDEKPAVWVVDIDTGTVSLQPVEVVAYREDTVEIGNGLTPDDLVVVAGVHRLHPGQIVRPVDRDNRHVPRS